MVSENFAGFKLSYTVVCWTPLPPPLPQQHLPPAPSLVSPALDTSRCLFHQRQTIANPVVRFCCCCCSRRQRRKGAALRRRTGSSSLGKCSVQMKMMLFSCHWHPGISKSHHHSWARCPIMLMCPEISAIMMLFTRRPLCIFDGYRSSDSENPRGNRHHCNIFPLFTLGCKLFPPPSRNVTQSFAQVLNNFKSRLLFQPSAVVARKQGEEYAMQKYLAKYLRSAEKGSKKRYDLRLR